MRVFLGSTGTDVEAFVTIARRDCVISRGEEMRMAARTAVA
jgi:hypothetical protein